MAPVAAKAPVAGEDSSEEDSSSDEEETTQKPTAKPAPAKAAKEESSSSGKLKRFLQTFSCIFQKINLSNFGTKIYLSKPENFWTQNLQQFSCCWLHELKVWLINVICIPFREQFRGWGSSQTH